MELRARPLFLVVASIVVASVAASGCGGGGGHGHGGGGGGGPGPSPSPTSAVITILSGNNQTGLSGAMLAAPLAVALTDGAGQALPGVAVTFAPGGGSVGTGTVTADAQGHAQTTFTL